MCTCAHSHLSCFCHCHSLVLLVPAACQQLLHHINEVDAVHDQGLQLQLQHMQLLLVQLKSLLVSACVPCGKRGIETTWLKHRASSLAVNGWRGEWEQYAHICTCVCTLPPELLLPLPLLAAPGACCQQLLHHINEVDAVHDQCLQLQIQHMQLLLDQLNGFHVSACVPCGNRHRSYMAKGWESGVAMETQKMGGRAVQWRVQVTKI